MSENVTSELIYEVLKDVRKGQGTLSEGQKATNQRLSAIEHHMAGVEHHMAAFHETATTQSDELEALKERVALIERRLELRSD